MTELINRGFAVDDSQLNAALNTMTETVETQLTTVHITYRPIIEWSQLIYSYFQSIGQLSSIHTLYELIDTNPETSAHSSEEWCSALDETLMFAVLNQLQKQNKCQLIKGATRSETGIKFRE